MASTTNSPTTPTSREPPPSGVRPPAAGEVLVVNRDPELRKLLAKALFASDLASVVVTTADECLAARRRSSFLFTLVVIGEPQDIDLVRRVHELSPDACIVAMARLATPDIVREVLAAGARDFWFGSIDLRGIVTKMVALSRDHGESTGRDPLRPAAARDDLAPAAPPAAEAASRAASLATEPGAQSGAAPVAEDDEPLLVCRSRRMQKLLEISRTVAPTDATVLIQGESGVGKELVAKMIHRLSTRRAGPFVEVNCGALPENLLESQLFGHEKGSFTGAVQRQLGLFEAADGGTIFLDEIGEMSPDMQVKLLRVLQSREFRRIGGSQVVKADVRVIAATNRELKAAVEDGTFRSDLYYRLNVISLEIPPLRERPEEIPPLVEVFCNRIAQERNSPARSFSPQALEVLQSYRWTGNVRELENCVERLLLLSKEERVEAKDIEEHLVQQHEAAGNSPFPVTLTLDDVKRIHIQNVLQANQGNKMRSARVLDINVKTLYNLMRRLEIKV